VSAQAKREVAKKNKTFETLMNEELQRMAKEDWASSMRQAENLQEEDFA
jgi:hypothetical protein